MRNNISQKEIERPCFSGPQFGSVWWVEVRCRLAVNTKMQWKDCRWSQETLAGEVRLGRTCVGGIERKVKNPTVTVVNRIAKAFECKLGDLLD